jgi:hypothetical protein
MFINPPDRQFTLAAKLTRVQLYWSPTASARGFVKVPDATYQRF